MKKTIVLSVTFLFLISNIFSQYEKHIDYLKGAISEKGCPVEPVIMKDLKRQSLIKDTSNFNFYHIYLLASDPRVTRSAFLDGSFVHYLSPKCTTFRMILRKNRVLMMTQSFVWHDEEKIEEGFYSELGFSYYTKPDAEYLPLIEFFESKDVQIACMISGPLNIYFGIAKDEIWVVDIYPKEDPDSMKTYRLQEFMNNSENAALISRMTGRYFR